MWMIGVRRISLEVKEHGQERCAVHQLRLA
jgi:hypothetical protein